MSEPIIRMAEKTARGLACKRELARAIAAKEKAPQPKTADDILVAWQLDYYARVLRPDEPRDSQAAASRPLAHQPGNQKSGFPEPPPFEQVIP